MIKKGEKPKIISIVTEKGNKYIYDICSNLIFSCSDVFIDIINLYANMSKGEIIKKLTSKHGINYISIESYYIYINSLVKNKSCFFCKYPKLSSQNYSIDLLRKENFNTNQLILELTQNCNFRCKYCSYSGNYLYMRKHKNLSMSWEIARKSIDYYCDILFSQERTKKNRTVSVGFYGGEPLLEFSLIKKCINYINKKIKNTNFNKFFLITSNGSLINDEILDYLIKTNIELNISLDGPKMEHNKYRIYKNGRGSFNKVWENITKIEKYDKKFYSDKVGFLVTIAKGHNLLKIRNFFNNKKYFNNEKITVNSVYDLDIIRKLKESSTYKKNINFLYSEYKKKLINGNLDNDIFLKAYFSRYFDDCKSIYYRPINHLIKYTPSCFPGSAKLFVTPDGKFHTCERINHYFPIGDYKTGIDFNKVKKVWDLYVSNIYKYCIDCENVHFCHTCLATVAKNGYFNSKSQCELQRRRLPLILKDFLSINEKNARAF